MTADELRYEFVEEVIFPLCQKYGKSEHEGYHVFSEAYVEHRDAHGSFAYVEDREERMKERVGFMMVRFFEWLYSNQGKGGQSRARQQHAPEARRPPNVPPS